MKTLKILNFMGITLMALCLTVNVQANERTAKSSTKKTIALNIDKPIIEFISSVCGNQLDRQDIVRMQKVLSQVDNVTITFSDKDASDYQLTFDSMNEQDLENWMFDQGYSVTDETDVQVPWMESMSFAADEVTEMEEVSVPWMENMHFTSDNEMEFEEVSVPWMESMHLG